MDSFFSFQHQFAQQINNEELDRHELQFMRPIGPLAPLEAFRVYQEDYQARLEGALVDTYRVVSLYLGDQQHSLFQEFIRSHPSQSFDLGDYGGDLPNFLSHKNYAILSQMAKFEWTFYQVFNAPAPKGMTAQQLSQVTNLPNRPLSLWPYAVIFYGHPQVLRIWELAQEEKFIDLPHDNEQEKHPYFFYQSPDGGVHIFEMVPTQAQIWNNILANGTLEAALSDLNDDTDPKLVQSFCALISRHQLINPMHVES